MPEPLATTKRKFHRLLDNLTRHANATVIPIPAQIDRDESARDRLLAAAERVNKRRRLGDEQPDTPTRSSSVSSNASTLRKQNKVLAVARTPKASHTTKATIPSFSPWSQESFLQRLKTFSSVASWHMKPDPINEVVWAKRGWQCVGVNTVACVGGCEHRVVVDLSSSHTHSDTGYDETDEQSLHGDAVDDQRLSNESADEALEEEENLLKALTERYADEVVNGHGDKCLWRRAGCKDDIYRLQVVRPAVWRPQLNERLVSITELGSSIEAVAITSIVTDASEDESLEIFHDIDAQSESMHSQSSDLRSKAIKIAMHGWYGMRDSHADLLQCHSCFQRIGLWMYQPDYHRRGSTQDEQDGSSTSATEKLDLLSMHREYCPWRSGTSQCASGSFAGLNACEILSRVVKTYTNEQRRSHNHPPTRDQEQDATTSPTEDHDIPPKPSREEEDQLDREREGRLQRLKRLLTLKRPRAVVQPI